MEREDEVVALEREVESRERDLHRALAEIGEELRAVATELEAVRRRLEEEGVEGELLARLAAAQVPARMPLEGHEARGLEVRADHARARMWVASALELEMTRFRAELGVLGRLAEEGRLEVSRLAPRDQRLARIRGYTDVPEPDSRRRVAPRVRFEVAVDLQSRSNFYTGVTENISEGGLFIATEERLPLGTEVELEFSVPTTGELIRARGEVRWTREPKGRLAGGIGVGFEELPAEGHAAIGRFLERRAPIVAKP